MKESAYSLDASGLIAGWLNYPPAVFPGLWERIEALAQSGRLLIAEDVYRELKPKDEELSKWLTTI